jgi:hypothetical protein
MIVISATMTPTWAALLIASRIIGDHFSPLPMLSGLTGPNVFEKLVQAWHRAKASPPAQWRLPISGQEKAVDRLASLDLCEALAAIEGRPWAEWGRSNKPITPNQFARLLKPFGVIPGNLRIGGRIVKGYYRHQFETSWERYPAAEGVYEPLQCYNTDGIGISNSIQNATVQAGVADEKSQKAPTNGHCSGVAVAAVGYNEGDSARPCDYCGRPGNLTEVGYGDVTAWLHRDCQNVWLADQNNLLAIQSHSEHSNQNNGGTS